MLRRPSFAELTPDDSVRHLPSLGPRYGRILESALGARVIGDLLRYDDAEVSALRNRIDVWRRSPGSRSVLPRDEPRPGAR